MIFYYKVVFHSVSKQEELIPVFVPENNSVRDHEIQELESLASEPGMAMKNQKSDYRDIAAKIAANADRFFKAAEIRIKSKAGTRIFDMNGTLNNSIKSEIEKIDSSYSMKIKEYEELLERQICQMKWFKKDMKSAITFCRRRSLAIVARMCDHCRQGPRCRGKSRILLRRARALSGPSKA